MSGGLESGVAATEDRGSVDAEAFFRRLFRGFLERSSNGSLKEVTLVGKRIARMRREPRCNREDVQCVLQLSKQKSSSCLSSERIIASVTAETRSRTAEPHTNWDPDGSLGGMCWTWSWICCMGSDGCRDVISNGRGPKSVIVFALISTTGWGTFRHREHDVTRRSGALSRTTYALIPLFQMSSIEMPREALHRLPTMTLTGNEVL